MNNKHLFSQGALWRKLQTSYPQGNVRVTSGSTPATYVKRLSRTEGCPVDIQGVSAAREFAEQMLNSLKHSLTGRLRDDSSCNESGSRVAREWLKVAAVFFLIFTLGITNAWGATYTLTFKTNSGDGTAVSTSTAASDCLSEGGDYVSGNLATATSAYNNGGSGMKLGVKSGEGDVKFSLSDAGQVVPTKVSVYAKLYNSSKIKTVQVCTNLGNNTATNATSSFAEYYYSYSGSAKLTYVEIKSSGYIWLQKIVVTYKAKVTFDANGGTCGTSSLTQSSPTASITLPTPTRSGFTCTGWYTTASGEGTKRGDAGGSYTPTASETLYARWASSGYTVVQVDIG